MNWTDVAGTVGKFAPMLGTLLGGPAGAAIGGIVAAALGCDNDPEAVNATVLANPDAAVKLKEIEANKRVRLSELVVQAEANRLANETQQLQSVNQTMQAETKSDHWPTYSWRPFIGFAFGSYIASLFVLPLLGVQPVTLSPDMTLAVGAILGVASWYRGKAQLTDNQSDKRG